MSYLYLNLELGDARLQHHGPRLDRNEHHQIEESDPQAREAIGKCRLNVVLPLC